MKTRIGFVSNSSSSSFILVGVSGDLAKELSKKDNCVDDGFGLGTGDHFAYADPNYDDDLEGDKPTFYNAGIDVEKLIKEKHYKEIAKDVKAQIEKVLGRKIKDSDIDLLIGEASNE